MFLVAQLVAVVQLMANYRGPTIFMDLGSTDFRI